MSEVFEALLKAQREADNQRGAPPQSSNGDSAGESLTAVVTPGVRRSRHRVFHWLPWRHNGNGQNGREPAIPWLIAPERRTVVAEQFRVLRTRIEMVGPATFMITSALDQEGKTLCAVNLAVALAMGVGSGTILVDADLRRPSAGSHFGGHGHAGLLDCLAGDARWQDCLMSTPHERLKVLPAGSRSAMAAELLASERMQAIIAEMKAEFPQHRILFDTPPILLTADPVTVAPFMDYVVLVVRAGVTPRRAVSKAIESLGADRFLGIILNDATDHVSDHYYYGSRYSYTDPTSGRE
jgi:protein-tyrosine kinase